MHRPISICFSVAVFLSCVHPQGTSAEAFAPLKPVAQPLEPGDPPRRTDAPTVLIRNATVMTAAGAIHAPGYVLMSEGKIDAVGAGDRPAPKGATEIDGTGLFVTPGLIDTHSHMGVYANPNAEAHEDGNEASSPTTPEIWAEHGFWPQDPSLWRALAGGVTTAQILPGSTNLIGGRTFVIHLDPQISGRLMRFPEAPQGLKIACGENPKRVYGGSKRAPQTRMGNVALFRADLQKAIEYRRKWEKYERELAKPPPGGKPKEPPDPPARDFGLETLVRVMDGRILVHNHCYRADEMSLMLDVAQEFGFKIRSFHHALEAYKLRHRLATEGVAVSTWADWWGFKMEAFDGVPQNLAMLSQAKARAIVHSDSETDIRRLNQEAAKGVAAGKKFGIAIDENEALRWVTANAAWALGIEQHVGTLEPGKMADVVLWSRHPFSVYALPMKVFVNGHLAYDRKNGPRLSDFELGIVDSQGLP